MLVRRYVGSRCGVSSRLTSDCRRSASPMITCVYSISCGRSSSRSSSCAAPRMPPSGFLISCARLRISSRFACCCSSRRSSRAILSCWSMCRNSSSSVASCASTGDTVQVRCSLRLAADARARAPARCTTRRSRRALSIAATSAAASPNTCARPCGRRAAPRELEQVLGGRIRVDDAQRAVEQQHRGREQLEARVGARRGCGRERRRKFRVHGATERAAAVRSEREARACFSKFRAGRRSARRTTRIARRARVT